jgi:hypothetical protein
MITARVQDIAVNVQGTRASEKQEDGSSGRGAEQRVRQKRRGYREEFKTDA